MSQPNNNNNSKSTINLTDDTPDFSVRRELPSGRPPLLPGLHARFLQQHQGTTQSNAPSNSVEASLETPRNNNNNNR